MHIVAYRKDAVSYTHLDVYKRQAWNFVDTFSVERDSVCDWF